MIWITLFSLAVSGAVAIWKIWGKPEEKRSHRLLLTLLIGSAIACSLYGAWQTWLRAQASAQATTNWQRSTTNQINLLGRSAGNEELMKNYVAALRAVTAQAAREKTEIAAKAFFDSRADRLKSRQEIEAANSKVLIAATGRYQPFVDSVTNKFDAWIAEIRKRGHRVESKSADTAAVNVAAPRNWRFIREAIFERGERLVVQIVPATVDDGQVTGELYVWVVFSPRPNSGKGDLQLLAMGENQERWWLTNPVPTKLKFKDAGQPSKNPVIEDGFTDAINNAFNETVEYALDETVLAN